MRTVLRDFHAKLTFNLNIAYMKLLFCSGDALLRAFHRDSRSLRMGLPVKGVFERGLIVVDSTYMIVYMYCPTTLHYAAQRIALSYRISPLQITPICYRWRQSTRGWMKTCRDSSPTFRSSSVGDDVTYPV